MKQWSEVYGGWGGGGRKIGQLKRRGKRHHAAVAIVIFIYHRSEKGSDEREILDAQKKKHQGLW